MQLNVLFMDSKRNTASRSPTTLSLMFFSQVKTGLFSRVGVGSFFKGLLRGRYINVWYEWWRLKVVAILKPKVIRIVKSRWLKSSTSLKDQSIQWVPTGGGSYSNLSSTFQETLKGSRNRLQQSLTDTSLVGTKGVVIIVFLPVILPFLPPPTHKNASVHHN